ncbi:MAG: sigma-54-dependent transcriptional regulator [Gemmatimonadota bacterium]
MADILIIDDHDSMREGLELLLRRRGHRTRSAASGKQGLALLEEAAAELVITDLKMARMDGIEVLRRVKESAPATEVMVITAHGTIEKVVEAMKLGAADFITKPFSSEEFGVKVDRLLADHAERARLRRENVALRVENISLKEEGLARYGEIVGESPPMQEVFRWIDRVARSDSTVMIYGESGTGKELVARAIHAGSPRRDGPFIRVNCGALNESLLDSELFGHEKGAFTGAEKQRRGRFELADGGTLFLDEIATVPHSTQVRLLRVLQERELERVGGEETIPVDVRIIAATNTTPEELQSGGAFREDLFYRLHVVPLTLPPLRERCEDIPLLVRHFIEKLRDRTASSVRAATPEALKALAAHDWPGNVRELENVIERALVMAEGEELNASDIPPLGTTLAPPVAPRRSGDAAAPRAVTLPESGVDLNQVVEGMEESLLRQALEQAEGVKAEAARLLGLKPSALYYKLEKYGIQG